MSGESVFTHNDLRVKAADSNQGRSSQGRQGIGRKMQAKFLSDRKLRTRERMRGTERLLALDRSRNARFCLKQRFDGFCCVCEHN